MQVIQLAPSARPNAIHRTAEQTAPQMWEEIHFIEWTDDFIDVIAIDALKHANLEFDPRSFMRVKIIGPGAVPFCSLSIRLAHPGKHNATKPNNRLVALD
jgi:hypothetical protein